MGFRRWASENATGGQENHLVEARVRLEARPVHGRLGPLLRRQHPGAVGSARDRVPERGGGRPPPQHSHPDALPSPLLRPDPRARTPSRGPRENPRTPACKAVRDAFPASARLSTTEPTLMMVPRRWAIIAGSTAWQHRNAPRRFTASA